MNKGWVNATRTFSDISHAHSQHLTHLWKNSPYILTLHCHGKPPALPSPCLQHWMNEREKMCQNLLRYVLSEQTGLDVTQRTRGGYLPSEPSAMSFLHISNIQHSFEALKGSSCILTLHCHGNPAALPFRYLKHEGIAGVTMSEYCYRYGLSEQT